MVYFHVFYKVDSSLCTDYSLYIPIQQCRSQKGKNLQYSESKAQHEAVSQYQSYLLFTANHVFHL